MWISETLDALLSGHDLTDEQMQRMIESFVSGQSDEAEMAALLIALRAKGETSRELAVAASVLRKQMIRLEPEVEVLDTCGPGGDGLGTFNISTATALVVAGCGVPVLKHGNRAISSRSGSADVLSTLGVEAQSDPEWPMRCLKQTNLGFCFAPFFHPALKHVAAVRRKLAVRTLFNCLGPLVHPAEAAHQLLGVGRPEWLNLLAGALAHLGVKRAILVSGSDGLDEVTLTGPTAYREVTEGKIDSGQWTPDDFDLAPCNLDELRVNGPEESANLILRILEGEEGAPARMVLANSAACLFVVGHASTLKEGVAMSREAIQSGQAMKVLTLLRTT